MHVHRSPLPVATQRGCLLQLCFSQVFSRLFLGRHHRYLCLKLNRAQCGERSIDSLYGHDDIHGLDYWAKKCADYLSSEPPDVFVKLIHEVLFMARKSRMESSGTTARRRAAHLKILLLHGDADPEVPYETSIWYAEFLRTSGFSVDFRTFNGLQHFWTYREMDYVKQWLRPRIAVPRITVPRHHGRL
ncbi:hypothetical protein ACQJBY_021990 [Aegilops geniculata]